MEHRWHQRQRTGPGSGTARPVVGLSRLSAYSVQELRTISTHWDLRHSDDLCASKVPLPYELISEIQRGAEPEVLNSVAQ